MSVLADASGSVCLVCGAQVSDSGEAIVCKCGACFRRLPDGLLGALGNSDEVQYPDDGAELTAQVEEASFWFRHRNEALNLLLERYPPGGTLWDIGGGNGFQARHFQQRGHRVVLVEPGEPGCRTALARGVRDVVMATLEALRLPSSSAAAFSLFDVLEHLAEPERLLAECGRALRPGGRLYVTVPAYPSLWSDEDEYAKHQRRYTRASLEEALRAGGFRVEYLSYYFRFLVVPIFLLRSLPYRLFAWRRGKAATMDQGQHAPGGVLQRLLEAALARELVLLQRGCSLRFGSSLVAVAVKP